MGRSIRLAFLILFAACKPAPPLGSALPADASASRADAGAEVSPGDLEPVRAKPSPLAQVASGPPDAAVVVPPEAAPEPIEDVAIVGRADGLYRVPLKGAPTRLTREQPAFCAVDARAQVVFYSTEISPPAQKEPDGTTSTPAKFTFTLKAIDLSEKRPPLELASTVIPGDSLFGGLRIHVKHPEPYGTLGSETETATGPDVGLELELSEKPRLHPFVNCIGDAAFSCYDYESEAGRRARGSKLRPEVAVLVKALGRLRLRNVEALTALFRRGAQRPLWRPEPPCSAEPVKTVAAKNCEDHEQCGRATCIAGTPYWSVLVESSRGDFYHETQQFYDPLRQVFFAPQNPKRFSKRPLTGDTKVSSFYVAPSGRALLLDGNVIDFQRGIIFRGEKGCGFVGPAWYHSQPYP